MKILELPNTEWTEGNRHWLSFELKLGQNSRKVQNETAARKGKLFNPEMWKDIVF